MTSKPPVSSRRLNYALAERWLRDGLTKLREQNGLTRTDVCRSTGISIRTIQRIENGPTPVSAENVAILCQLYGTTREHEKELQRLRHYSQQTGWWDEYRKLLGPVYAEHCEAEQQALRIDTFGPFIPGLFQTEEYAHCIQSLGFRAKTGKEAEDYVKLRLRRQEEFLRGPRRRARVLCELHGLRHPFCAGVIEKQLEYLQDLEQQGCLELRIATDFVPPTNFVIFTFAGMHLGKKQRSMTCYNGFIGDEAHRDEIQQTPQPPEFFDHAWECASLLSEVSI